MSWDIYYHVHLAEFYLEYGFTYFDPLTVAPLGRPIAYPPVFHFLLAGLSYVSGTDPFQVARYLQPVLAMALVLSITYVTYRLFGFISGISAGILTIFSLITINRGFFASPCTLSLILMPLVLYGYYRANEDGNFKLLLVSAVLCGVGFLTHSLTAFMVLVVVFAFTAVMKLLKRSFNPKYLAIFLTITAVMALLWWGPLYILYHPQFNIFPGYPLPISEYYIRYLGIIPTLLATLGGLSLLRKGENKDIFILVWSLSTLILSRAYLIGVDLIPIRVLEVASYPLIIMGGYGLAVTLDVLEKILNKNNQYKTHQKINSSKNPFKNLKKHIKLTVLILLSAFTLISGAVFADGYTPNLISPDDLHSDYIFPESVHILFNPLDDIFKFQVIADRFGDLTLAQNREGVVDWFKYNGERDKTVYSVDSYLDTIIISTTRMKVIKGGYSESIPLSVFKRNMDDVGSLNREQLLKDNIKYLLLRNGMTIPLYAQEVYRNGNYVICVVE
ncbi:MAG: glycosyltransferase family 39 protein [Methanobacterium sp.]